MESDSSTPLWLGDKLPTIHEATRHLFFLSPSGANSAKRTDAIHAYTTSLYNLWVKSCTSEHVLHFTSVRKKMLSIMSDHDKLVLGHARYGYSSRGIAPKSLWQLNKEWRLSLTPELYQKSLGRPPKHSTTPMHTQEENRSNDVLLDIGRDMDKLTDQEKIFVRIKKE